MAKKVLDVQCPNCNAPLHFNSKIGKMKCKYCDGEFDPELFKNKDTEEKEENIDYVLYNCPDCGAQIVADDQTSATFCLYCGNTAILKNKLSGEFRPSKIIPFKTEKQQAIDAFKNIGKGKPFMPKSFNNEKNIEKITGLYVPFWLYDVLVSGGLLIDAVNVTSWTSGDTHYTKKDFYKVEREGTMNFLRVPVDGSTRFENDVMNSIEPYDYNELIDYNHAYLSGFLAERYDVSKEDAFTDAKTRSLKSASDIMLSDAGHYSTKTITTNTLDGKSINDEYVLLPVWMVNVKYEDNYYIFAMNGQTGKFIGNIPLDKKKVVFRYIITFIIAFAIIMLLSYIIFLLGGNNV